MNRNFILVFILLATLSMVNAIPHQLHKRDTTFSACPPGLAGPDTALLTVTISPDPPASEKTEIFTVSGTLPAATTSQTEFIVAFLQPDGSPISLVFNTIPAGETTITNLEGEGWAPKSLPNSFAVATVIVEPPAGPGDPPSILGCAFATVGSALPKDFKFPNFL